jgi:hypothetical protein
VADFSADDVRYIEEAYVPLELLCAERGVDPEGLPQPAYVLPDGRRMVPRDYFELLDDAGGREGMRERFESRLRAAAAAAGLEFGEEWNPESEWTDYLEGTYAVCLWSVTPEAMVEKERLIRTIRALVDRPEPASAAWKERLADAVGALDALERPFTDYDRARWEYTTRALYITDVRARFPEAFA